jgi:hypothetical protein
VPTWLASTCIGAASSESAIRNEAKTRSITRNYTARCLDANHRAGVVTPGRRCCKSVVERPFDGVQ